MNENCIVEVEGKKFVDVVRLLPENLPSGKKILWRELDNGLIEISVDKHSARGGNPATIEIKRLIEVNEDLTQLLGLWFGDGIKIQGGVFNVFGFGNTEMTLITRFLNLSENCLSMPREDFGCRISIPPDLEDKTNEIENEISSKFNLPLENFWETHVNGTRNFTFVDVKINSRFLGFIIKQMFEKLREVIINSKEFSAKFIQGVIASEANIFLRDNVRLENIFIAAKDKQEREFLRKCLKSFNIQPNKDKETKDQEGIPIQGISNFKLVKSWNLISLNPKKLEAFERGFKIEQSRKGELRLKVLELLQDKPSTRQELGKLLNRSPATIRTEALFVLEDQGLVKRGQIQNKSRLWKITIEGSEILKLENPLEILRARKPKYETYDIASSNKLSKIDHEQILTKIEKKFQKIIADNPEFS